MRDAGVYEGCCGVLKGGGDSNRKYVLWIYVGNNLIMYKVNISNIEASQ